MTFRFDGFLFCVSGVARVVAPPAVPAGPGAVQPGSEHLPHGYGPSSGSVKPTKAVDEDQAMPNLNAARVQWVQSS